MFTTEKKASMYYEKFGEFPCMHDVMLVCNVNNLVLLCISYFYIDMDTKFSLIFQRNIKESRIKKISHAFPRIFLINSEAAVVE